MNEEFLTRLSAVSAFVDNKRPITILGLTNISEALYLANERRDLCRVLDVEDSVLYKKYAGEKRVESIGLSQYALYTTVSYCKDKFSQYVIDADTVARLVNKATFEFRAIMGILQASIATQVKGDCMTIYGDEMSVGYLVANSRLSLKEKRVFTVETIERLNQFAFKVYHGVKTE